MGREGSVSHLNRSAYHTAKRNGARAVPPRLTLAATLLTMGCAGEVPETGAIVRDSAGVTIVHNAARAGGEHFAALGPRILVIRDEGLYRIGGIVRMSDGSIVVANRGSQSLHFYSSEGTPLYTAGGSGDGPGEFGSLLNIFPGEGDAIGAYDARNRRVTVFGPTGEHMRTSPLLVDGVIQDVRAFADGSLSVLMGAQGAAQRDVREMYRDTLTHFRASADGQPLDTIGRHAGQIQHVFAFEIGDQVARMPTPHHYAPRAIVAASGDGYLVGDGAEYEIRRHSLDGRLQMIARLGDRADRTPVTDELRGDLIARRREAYAAAAERFAVWRMLSDALDQVPSAEVLPAFGTGRHSILVDDSGGFWVAHFMIGDEPERFDIFSSEGVYRATVEMPDGFRAWVVSDESVVGVRTSELDEEWIEGYSIRLPAAAQGRR